MESKTARLTILVDPAKKRAFERLCAAQDLTPSQVVRQLIREYLAAHGVTWQTRTVVPGAAAPAARAKARARRVAARGPRRR
ncbi:MAG: ribbon-helix-helix protein, CopG family [Burkholderiales bacterium]|nr:ribbon-helix-helix protein, CopG family [Burkholderiales bacterium]